MLNVEAFDKTVNFVASLGEAVLRGKSHPGQRMPVMSAFAFDHDRL